MTETTKSKSKDLAIRVKTQTQGMIAVEQEGFTLQDLYDFVEQCDLHGVSRDEDIAIEGNAVYDAASGGRRHNVKMAVSAPVDFVYGPTSPPLRPVPRSEKSKALIKRAPIVVPAAIVAVFAFIILFGLIERGLGWATSWAF